MDIVIDKDYLGIILFSFFVLITFWCWYVYRRDQKAKQAQGRQGEAYLSRQLSSLPKDYILLNDLLLRYDHHTVQIDHVVISPYGVFVVETKNFRGEIYGSSNDKQWLQVNKSRKRYFYNPVMQNRRHCQALSAVCRISFKKIFSLIVFIGRCDLHVKDAYNLVMSKDVIGYIKQFQDQCLSQNDIEWIYHRLKSKNITSSYIRNSHVSYASKLT